MCVFTIVCFVCLTSVITQRINTVYHVAHATKDSCIDLKFFIKLLLRRNVIESPCLKILFCSFSFFLILKFFPLFFHIVSLTSPCLFIALVEALLMGDVIVFYLQFLALDREGAEFMALHLPLVN